MLGVPRPKGYVRYTPGYAMCTQGMLGVLRGMFKGVLRGMICVLEVGRY